MTRDQLARVKQLFFEAIEMPPESRYEWLTRVAADDAEVLQEAESLVRAHERLPLEPGVRIDEYEIRREMRSGPMSAVYLAQDLKLDRLTVLKTVPAINADDQSRLEYLRREARAASAVSHSGVATVYRFVESPFGNFIASEYIQGRTLRDEITSGAVESVRAVRWSIEIAQALSAAHDAHVIHRDLKPENVMVTTSGAIKIIDFGIARIVKPDETLSTFTGHGTVGYMAPEQAVPGMSVDHRADLYSFGVILAEMVLGCHPFEEGTSGMPAPLRAIADRCLQSNRERRYQSARDLWHDLENVVSGRPVDQVPGDRRMLWWRFHQGSAALIYWSAVIPQWYARELIGGAPGRTLFYVTLAAVIPASILRLHSWFTSCADPPELPRQLRRERPWIAAGDALFAISLILSGVLVGEARMSLATSLICVGFGSAIVALFIEPTSTRGALASRPGVKTSQRATV